VIASAPLRSRVGGDGLAPVDLSWEAHDGGFRLANPVRPVQVGGDADDGAGFVEDGVMVAPVTSAGGADASAERVGATVFFANVDRDTDYLVQPDVAGWESSFVLRSAQSPEQVQFEYRLRPGLSLQAQGGDVNRVEVLRGEDVVAVTGAVHAFDATGAIVEVSSRLQGDRLVVSVPHRGAAVQYPIVVDPETTYVVDFGQYQDVELPWQFGNGYFNYLGFGNDLFTGMMNLDYHTLPDVTGRRGDWSFTSFGTAQIVSFSGTFETVS
jgi:hypothetical protein